MVQFIRSLFLGALVLAMGLALVGCGKDVKPTTEKPSSQDKMMEKMADKAKETKERMGKDAGAADKDKDKDKGKGNDKDKNEDDKE